MPDDKDKLFWDKHHDTVKQPAEKPKPEETPKDPKGGK